MEINGDNSFLNTEVSENGNVNDSSTNSMYQDVATEELQATMEDTATALNYIHSGNPNLVSQGDEYLCTFSSTPGPLPWAVCNEMLVYGYPNSPFTHVFFAANTLQHKLSNDFHTLNEDNVLLIKEQIINALVIWNDIAKNNGDIEVSVKPTLNQLCLAIGTLAVQINWQGVLEEVVKILIERDVNTYYIIEVLISIAEECHSSRLVIDEDVRDDFEHYLQKNSIEIHDFCSKLDSIHQLDKKMQVQLYKCLETWFYYFGGSFPAESVVEIPLVQKAFDKLNEALPQKYVENIPIEDLTDAMQTYSDPSVYTAINNALIEIIIQYPDNTYQGNSDKYQFFKSGENNLRYIFDPQKTYENMSLINLVLPSILSICESKYSLALEYEDEDLLKAMSKLLSTAAEEYTKIIISDDYLTAEQHEKCFTLLLHFTSHPSSSIWSETTHFWYRFQRTLLANQSFSFSKLQTNNESIYLLEKYRTILQTLSHVVIPIMTYKYDEDLLELDNDECYEFYEDRNLVLELLTHASQLLGIYISFDNFILDLDTSIQNFKTNSKDWKQFEAILAFMRTLCIKERELHDDWESFRDFERNQTETREDFSLENEVDQSSDKFVRIYNYSLSARERFLKEQIPDIVNTILSIENINDQPTLLMSTIMAFLASISIHIVEFYPDSLQEIYNFLISGFQNSRLCRDAAKAIRTLCDHCSKAIGEDFCLLFEHLTSARLNGLIQYKDELIVLEGICLCVSDLEPVSLHNKALNDIATPVYESLSSILTEEQRNISNLSESSCQNGNGTPESFGKLHELVYENIGRLETILQYAKKNENEDALATLVRDFWPIIVQVLQEYESDEQIMEKMYSTLGLSLRTCDTALDDIVTPLLDIAYNSFTKYPYGIFVFIGSSCFRIFIRIDRKYYLPSLIQYIGLISPLFFQYLDVSCEINSKLLKFSEPNILNEEESMTSIINYHHDLIDEYYYFLDQFLRSAPESLLLDDTGIEIIRIAYDFAIRAMLLSEQEKAIDTMLRFLDGFITWCCLTDSEEGPGKYNDMNNTESANMASNTSLVVFESFGRQLLTNCIFGIIGKLPKYFIEDQKQSGRNPSLGTLVSILYHMYEVCSENENHETFNSWLADALASVDDVICSSNDKMELINSLTNSTEIKYSTFLSAVQLFSRKGRSQFRKYN